MSRDRLQPLSTSGNRLPIAPRGFFALRVANFSRRSSALQPQSAPGWTWYATEGSPDGNDFVFFGYVQGIEAEWGTFSLSELQSIRGALGLPVERTRPVVAIVLMNNLPSRMAIPQGGAFAVG